MDFAYTPKVEELRRQLAAFMDEFVYPNERRFEAWLAAQPDRWSEPWPPLEAPPNTDRERLLSPPPATRTCARALPVKLSERS